MYTIKAFPLSEMPENVKFLVIEAFDRGAEGHQFYKHEVGEFTKRVARWQADAATGGQKIDYDKDDHAACVVLDPWLIENGAADGEWVLLAFWE